MSSFALPLSDDFIAALAERVKAHVPDQPERRFLSKKALAEHYGVSERTIKTFREKGLPGVRVGREVLYDVAACDRWIESHA
jgi:phage terminase Nu1 subunit (DNA packaging protein)